MTKREELVARLNEAIALAKDLQIVQPRRQLRYGGWPNRATQVMFSWLAIDPVNRQRIAGISEGWKMETLKLSKSETIHYLADLMRKDYQASMPSLPPGAHSQILLECAEDIDWGEIAARCLNGTT